MPHRQKHDSPDRNQPGRQSPSRIGGNGTRQSTREPDRSGSQKSSRRESSSTHSSRFMSDEEE